MRVAAVAAVAVAMCGCADKPGSWTYRQILTTGPDDGDIALSDSGELHVLVHNRQDEVTVVCSLAHGRAEPSEPIATEFIDYECWSGVRLAVIGEVPHVIGRREDDIWYMTRGDGGWSAPANLSGDLETAQGRRVQAADLAEGADGDLVAVYASVPADGLSPGEIRVARLIEGALDAPIGLPDSGGCSELGPDDREGLDALFDGDGNLHVVAACGADLYWATNAAGAWASERETHDVLVHDPALALGPNGDLHRAWTIGEWQTGHRLDPSIAHSSLRDGEWSAMTEAVEQGETPLLAVTPDGTVFIAYRWYSDYDNGTVMPRFQQALVRCSARGDQFETLSELRPQGVAVGHASAILVEPGTGAVHLLVSGGWWIATSQGRFDCPL